MENPGLKKALHVETPLLWSPVLSARTGHDIWLKLENVQNASSYKIRGIGRFCQEAVRGGANHLVSSSGGNAGLAAAFAAKKLGVQCTVIVPEPTAAFMKEKFVDGNTNLQVHGASWDDAHKRAIELSNEEGAVLVHPFEGEVTWEGHSTLVDELVAQVSTKPDAVFLSVGGGGLLSGVLLGMHRHGWADVPLVAVETEGAKSFNICVESGEWRSLDKIDTIAKSLGAKQVAKRAFDWISEHKPTYSEVVSDQQAAKACLLFADDHRFLIGPAAGATLAPIYDDCLSTLQMAGKLPQGKLNILAIVCGGNEVNLEELAKWKTMFNL